MKKQPKKAKPVEAWWVDWDGPGSFSGPDAKAMAESWARRGGYAPPIRLVPATSEAEVRRLKRIERAAREWYQDMRGWSLAPESKRLFDALSTSLRFKRTKP